MFLFMFLWKKRLRGQHSACMAFDFPLSFNHFAMTHSPNAFLNFSGPFCHVPPIGRHWERTNGPLLFSLQKLSWRCCYSLVFMERFNCTLPGSPDQVSAVPPLDLPQAQLPGKAFTIKCETRAVLPRESWRRGCWLSEATVWNFFAVCHTHREKWKQM